MAIVNVQNIKAFDGLKRIRNDLEKSLSNPGKYADQIKGWKMMTTNQLNSNRFALAIGDLSFSGKEAKGLMKFIKTSADSFKVGADGKESGFENAFYIDKLKNKGIKTFLAQKPSEFLKEALQGNDTFTLSNHKNASEKEFVTAAQGYSGDDLFEMLDQVTTNDESFPVPYQINPGPGRDIISWGGGDDSGGMSRVEIDGFNASKDKLFIGVDRLESLEILTFNGDTYLIDKTFDPEAESFFGNNPYVMFKGKELSLGDLNIVTDIS